jgi:sterol desaturase/sphingolipid hydroxylase (fatty acid hydroxylase superfamily)
MALWECCAPRRAASVGRPGRWPGNLGVALLDALVVRVVAPTGAVGFATLAEARGWGVFHHVGWPAGLEVLTAFVLLDFAIYGQHRVMHVVPALWRLHRMHHADLDFDVTTGVRFHPLEILLSLGIKFVAVALLGAAPAAVLAFEVVLNACALFNHSNVGLPARWEGWVRWLVVTPDMHRVHHSIVRAETDRNFGFNLPWWDRLFGTYQAQPAAGQEAMVLGVEELRQPEELKLHRMLAQPFVTALPPESHRKTG